MCYRRDVRAFAEFCYEMKGTYPKDAPEWFSVESGIEHPVKMPKS